MMIIKENKIGFKKKMNLVMELELRQLIIFQLVKNPIQQLENSNN